MPSIGRNVSFAGRAAQRGRQRRTASRRAGRTACARGCPDRLAKIGTDTRRRQQVGRRDPRIAIEPGQRRDDARLRGADDRLIDGGEQRREQQPGQGPHQLRGGSAGPGPTCETPISVAAVTDTPLDVSRLRDPERGADHGAAAGRVDERQRMQQRRSQLDARRTTGVVVDMPQREGDAQQSDEQDAGGDRRALEVISLFPVSASTSAAAVTLKRAEPADAAAPRSR